MEDVPRQACDDSQATGVRKIKKEKKNKIEGINPNKSDPRRAKADRRRAFSNTSKSVSI